MGSRTSRGGGGGGGGGGGALSPETLARAARRPAPASTSISSASKKLEASRQRALKKAKQWMERTGGTAAQAAREFDLVTTRDRVELQNFLMK